MASSGGPIGTKPAWARYLVAAGIALGVLGGSLAPVYPMASIVVLGLSSAVANFAAYLGWAPAPPAPTSAGAP